MESPAIRALWLCQDNLHIKSVKEVPHYEWIDAVYGKYCRLVPNDLKTMFELCNDIMIRSQQGTLVNRRLTAVKQLSEYTIEYVKGCNTCNENKKPLNKPRAALTYYHAGFPMERVHLDIFGPQVHV